MEKQTVTISDVAERAGVSMATVSRVVNGNQNVKPMTRKKVLAVIDELDYRPNAVARGLASKRTTTIGVIVPSISDTFFATLADGINDIATMYHYDILLMTPEPVPGGDAAAFNSLLAKQVDGIIYIGYTVSEKLQQEFNRTQTPVVLAGTTMDSENIASVNIDHHKATHDAIAHLTQTHEKIALVVGPLINHINGHSHLEGYKQALLEAGLNYQEGFVFESPYTLDAGQKLAQRIMNSGATAAFIADDVLAVGVMNQLIEDGVNIPEDFEIISANDTIYTDIVRPTLSSIQHPLYDIGAVSMRLLTKLMNSEEIEERNIILPYNIHLKGSTKV